MPYLLITDVFFRKAFDVIALLQKQFDYECIIGIPTVSALARFQAGMLYKGHKEILRVKNSSTFCHDLLNISRKYEPERIVYIPVEESTTDYFYHFCRVYGTCNFAYKLPPYSVFCMVRDKQRLNAYCLEHAIPAPKLYTSLKGISESDLPLILKPRIGSGSAGIIRICTCDELKALREVAVENYVVQELLPDGRNVKGAFFLAHRGTLISAYTHERIRTSPPEGGVSVLSQASCDTGLIEVGRKLIESLHWTGLLMLEFLFDERCGQYKVIEANPRIWGSIMLSEYCGSSILENYVRLCCHLPLSESHVRIGDKIRWFFPVDLLNYIRSGFRIRDFWNFRDTCFINWSYAVWYKSLLFNVCSVFNKKNIQRFFR